MCFLKAEKLQVRNLKSILSIFEIISGLKVNLSKSSLAGIEVIENDLISYAQTLGCTIGE